MVLSLTLFIILPLLVIGTFFLYFTTFLLPKLTEKSLLEILQSKRFYYLPIHRIFFKGYFYELLQLTTHFATHVTTMGFIGFSLYAFLSFFPILNPLNITLFTLILFLITLLCDLFARMLASSAYNLRFFQFFLTTISTFMTLTLPITFWPLKIMERKKEKMSRDHEEDQAEKLRKTLSEIMQSAELSGPLNASDKKLIEAVIKFKDRLVREVMIPRSELFSLPTTTTLKEAAYALVQEGFSRIPVYRGNIDNIIGVLMFKDLFEIYKDCLEGKKEEGLLNQSVGNFVKGVLYSPETQRVSQLLQEFRLKQMHMAIVVDEYGGTEGVVTIEDILEEIVGDISDEYDLDDEALYVVQPGGSSWIVDAKMSIFDAENIFDLHIPKEGDYDTIGGFIFHKVGAIPEPKTVIECENFSLEILSVTERNVEKVRLTALGQSPKDV